MRIELANRLVKFEVNLANLATFLVTYLRTLLCIVAITSPAYPDKLVFNDEFDGRAGKAVDVAKWTVETGGSGWGNKELQYYTDSGENAYVDDGLLVIKAVKLDSSSLRCWYGKCEYASARLITRGKFELRYGRFEARIKVPRGPGVWPAFWLLGSNIDRVGWPRCGEIDVMEHIGREPSTIYGTIHGPGHSGANGLSGSYIFPNGQKVSDEFHVYAVEWTKNEIRWFVDGMHFKTATPKDLSRDAQWVFDQPFFIILNFAVGGQWPGSPDDTTAFPQAMLVDYIRVYSR